MVDNSCFIAANINEKSEESRFLGFFFALSIDYWGYKNQKEAAHAVSSRRFFLDLNQGPPD